MTDAHTYKAALEAELSTLHTALDELGTPHTGRADDYDETPGNPAETEADQNIVADRHEEWHTRRAEVTALEERLQNVAYALKKISHGTFGTCEVCSDAIESARLDANPAARTCVTHREVERPLPG